MHVEIIKAAELAANKRRYVGKVGRIVEQYIMLDRSRVMFAGGDEVILPDAALRRTAAPRKRRTAR